MYIFIYLSHPSTKDFERSFIIFEAKTRVLVVSFFFYIYSFFVLSNFSSTSLIHKIPFVGVQVIHIEKVWGGKVKKFAFSNFFSFYVYVLVLLCFFHHPFFSLPSFCTGSAPTASTHYSIFIYLF